MFTRAQRNRLQELSLQVLGSETAYAKLIKDPQFQVITGVKEVEESCYYDHIPVVNQRTGKKSFKSVKRFFNKDNPPQKKQIPLFREMTFDELESALIAASEMKGFQALLDTDASVFYETIVAKYLDGTIINRPFLFVAEADKPEFDSTFSILTEEQKNVLGSYVVPNMPKSGTFVVDGVKFVDELVYRNSHVNEVTPES